MSTGDKIEEFMASVTNQDCYFSESSQEEWNEEQGFQLKMLNDQEKQLLTSRDENFLRTFHENAPDIPLPEMAKSESNAKFALSTSTQRSITLERDVNINKKLEQAWFQIFEC